MAVTDITPIAQQDLSLPDMILKGVHGTCFSNGYIWCSCRNAAYLGRVPINDYANYEVITPSDMTANMESVIKAKNLIWVSGTGVTNKTFWITTDLSNSGSVSPTNSFGPSVADGQYLYSGSSIVNKIDLTTKSVVLSRDISDDVPPPNLSPHAMVQDGDYLYISSAPPGDTASGGWFQKVRKSDLVTESYARIPMCTDDMGQDSSYCYLGIEVPQSATGSIGYSSGSIRISKSDLSIYSVPRFESETLSSVCYSTQVFGEYLFDCKTNNHIYVMSLPDLTLVKDYRLVGLDNSSGSINEIIRDDEGYFHLTQWNNNGYAGSCIVKVQLDLVFHSSKSIVISE